MAHKVTCDVCHHVLRVEDGVQDHWLTCPRCLAQFVNPAAIRRADSQAVAPETAPPEPPRNCPDCGAPVEPAWRYCPECDFPLRPSRRLRPAAPDKDVRADTLWIGGGLIALAALGTVALITALCGGWELSAEAIVALFGTLFVVAVAGFGIGLSSRKPGAAASMGLLGGLTIGLVVAAVPFAFLIAVFNACSKGCQQGRPVPPPGRRSAAPLYCPAPQLAQNGSPGPEEQPPRKRAHE
jgi:hypothetical protein